MRLVAACCTAFVICSVGAPPAFSASTFASPDTYAKLINLWAEIGRGDVRLALEDCNGDKTSCRFGDGRGISCLVSGKPHHIDEVGCLLGDRSHARQFLELANLTMLMLSPDASQDEREITLARMGESARSSESQDGEAQLYGVQYGLGVGGLFASFTAKAPPD
jgi:hypothetical protein